MTSNFCSGLNQFIGQKQAKRNLLILSFVNVMAVIRATFCQFGEWLSPFHIHHTKGSHGFALTCKAPKAVVGRSSLGRFLQFDVQPN